MSTVGQKADYVRSEAKRNTTFDHHCHWPGCEKSVPPAMWGCKAHWFKLPPRLRAKVWADISARARGLERPERRLPCRCA